MKLFESKSYCFGKANSNKTEDTRILGPVACATQVERIRLGCAMHEYFAFAPVP